MTYSVQVASVTLLSQGGIFEMAPTVEMVCGTDVPRTEERTSNHSNCLSPAHWATQSCPLDDLFQQSLNGQVGKNLYIFNLLFE